MGKIRVLPEVVASQVAAGEVVERPASVIKELLDNSLDSGAQRLEIEVRGAGTALLRVTDDGAGMDREDALMALERHATSKISVVADLAVVRTMGFRGEALPSIASVSEFTLQTRLPEAAVGTEVLLRGGKIERVRDAGCAAGTTMVVKSLFFNLPARRKFLRSAATETAHLDRVVETAALAFPGVSFHYIRDGRTIYRLPSVAGAAARVADLYGVEAQEELLEVPQVVSGGIKVSGLVSRPGVTRADRGRQFFFINGRIVENSFLSTGIREAYRQMLEPGRHPVVLLYLEMDPALVDCNVHPAKREVRFRHGGGVGKAVQSAVESALSKVRASWLAPVQNHVVARMDSRAEPVVLPSSTGAYQPELPRPVVPMRTAEVPPISSVGMAEASGVTQEEFRLVGSLSRRYLLLEGPEGLVLLDQRAANLRILFERLRRGLEGGAVASQRLLAPEVLELSPRDHQAVVQNLEVLASAGFGVEVFGARSLKVEALPDFLAGREPRRVMEDFAEECLAGGVGGRGAAADDAARRALARLAVGLDGASDEVEQRLLVTQLLGCELPYCDPEGRPVMLQFSWRELDKKFGRS